MIRMMLMVIPMVLLAQMPQAMSVKTAPVSEGKVNPLHHVVGTVNFVQISDIASETEGKVKAVYFDRTSNVAGGDALVEIDAAILNARIKSAEATLAAAKADVQLSKRQLERFKKLIKEESVTDQEFDEVRFQYDRLEATARSRETNLEELKAEQKKKTIRAPFKGMMVAKNVEVGEWVGKGSVIGRLVSTDRIEATFFVSESLARGVKPKQMLKVSIAGRMLNGRVDGLILQGDARSRTVPVKVTLKTHGELLYDGMEATLELPGAVKRSALLVPRDAVIHRFDQDVVFIDNKGMAMMVPVRIVGYTRTHIAIETSMIQPGMPVVVKGNERIFPNMPIAAQ